MSGPRLRETSKDAGGEATYMGHTEDQAPEIYTPASHLRIERTLTSELERTPHRRRVPCPVSVVRVRARGSRLRRYVGKSKKRLVVSSRVLHKAAYMFDDLSHTFFFFMTPRTLIGPGQLLIPTFN